MLLRSVMDDAWRPDTAARDLLVSVRADRRLLQLLRARIARVMLERPSTIAERADITLDRALSQGATALAAHTLVPRQGGRLV